MRGGLTLATPMRASPTLGTHNITRYDDDDNTFSNKTPTVFSTNDGTTDQIPDVDGKVGFLSILYNDMLSGGTDNHNVTTLFNTALTLDAEL